MVINMNLPFATFEGERTSATMSLIENGIDLGNLHGPQVPVSASVGICYNSLTHKFQNKPKNMTFGPKLTEI